MKDVVRAANKQQDALNKIDMEKRDEISKKFKPIIIDSDDLRKKFPEYFL